MNEVATSEKRPFRLRWLVIPGVIALLGYLGGANAASSEDRQLSWSEDPLILTLGVVGPALLVTAFVWWLVRRIWSR